MTNQELYRSKLGTVQDCLSVIESGDVICFAGEGGEAKAICREFHTLKERGVKNLICIKGRDGDYPFVTQPGYSEFAITRTNFFAKPFREGMKHGNVSYIPSDLNDFMGSVQAFRPHNVFIAAVPPMDENGDFWLGTCLMWEAEGIKTCSKIILQVNSNLPMTNGSVKINIHDVTALMEQDDPLSLIPDMPATETEERISANVASLVRDGDCIQLGIGSLPNAIARHLMDKKDLGLHTEMFTSMMGEMIRKGVITGERKNINKGLHIGCFAGGDAALFHTLNDDPNCVIAPANYAVNPLVIMQNDNQISINTILEIDLTGQVCSETIGTAQYSGSGGAFDFAWGAMHSKGGRGILAFPSTAKGGTVSKIKPILTPGSAVTIPRSYVDYIVTEHGIAHLRGRDVRERVEALISIAHPDFRADLREQARKMLYI